MLLHTASNRLFRTVTWPLALPVLRLAGFRENAWLEEALRYHVNEQTVHSLRCAMRNAGFPQPGVSLDPNVIRNGEHDLTAGLDTSPFARLAAGAARVRPLRLLLSNDLCAVRHNSR